MLVGKRFYSNRIFVIEAFLKIQPSFEKYCKLIKGG